MAKPWLDTDDTVARAKPMARAPVNMHNQVGAELGKVIELQMSEHLVTFTRSKPKLVWFPGVDVLGWWHDLKDPRATEDHVFALDQMGADIQPAIRTFQKFNDRYESGAYTVDFPFRSTRDWYSIDRAVQIKYWSDKWGATNVDYVHDFRPNTRLYIYGSPRPGGPSFWILRGGGLKVGARGID
jgi:hypothetical protein